jgi:hypothetical protein
LSVRAGKSGGFAVGDINGDSRPDFVIGAHQRDAVVLLSDP